MRFSFFVTLYYYNRENIIAEGTVAADGSVTFKARYVRGAQLIYREDANRRSKRNASIRFDNQKAYYLHNGHGDVTALLKADGTVLNRYTYDIWGNPLTSDVQVENPFGYSGEFWDGDTGLQYLRSRWYDPSIGRFIQEDTFEGYVNRPSSLNPYTYVENNPLKYVDPNGYAGQYVLGDKEYGNYAHTALQKIFKSVNLFVNPNIAFTEQSVTYDNGGKGRLDFALHKGNDQYEIYELKTVKWQTGDLHQQGVQQLEGYVDAINTNGFRGEADASARKGTSWNPDYFTIPDPYDNDLLIRYYTHANDPGMIYYGNVQRKPKKGPVVVPTTEEQPSTFWEKFLDTFKYRELPGPDGLPPIGDLKKQQEGGWFPIPVPSFRGFRFS
ncbi:hypothetical protein CDO73_02575 [Saccharibacillus sp. O23]|uniref:RHS repeat-associated core domain-containing protein n=1 Tax=Saccharibacillus sp. O23 TaxID=2009338 RepID=UPI000B4E5174|nr:RHS repeat-associated core domain-containing protein [Saccharibacillus sp. O23]OWR32507.1 hypothetical protein CDO73_02575 [Saccharibacillus sp. O23]